VRRFLIAAFCLALIGATANLLFWLAVWHSSTPTFESFSCIGDAAYCKGEYNEVLAELQIELLFGGVLFSFVIAVALFGATMLAGWLYERVRARAFPEHRRDLSY
jgi:hypothetical protein